MAKIRDGLYDKRRTINGLRVLVAAPLNATGLIPENYSARVKHPAGDIDLEMDADNFGSVIHAQFEKAKKGDTQAAKFLADLMGEMEQTQNLNIGGQEGGEPLRIVDTRKVHRSPLIIDETPEGEATEQAG